MCVCVCAAEGPRPRRRGEGEDGWLPLTMPVPPAEITKWNIFTDGSGLEPGKAGWGVAIFADGPSNWGERPLYQLCGPVIIDRQSHLFLGAEVATNNTGELTAMMEALLW